MKTLFAVIGAFVVILAAVVLISQSLKPEGYKVVMRITPNENGTVHVQAINDDGQLFEEDAEYFILVKGPGYVGVGRDNGDTEYTLKDYTIGIRVTKEAVEGSTTKMRYVPVRATK